MNLPLLFLLSIMEPDDDLPPPVIPQEHLDILRDLSVQLPEVLENQLPILCGETGERAGAPGLCHENDRRAINRDLLASLDPLCVIYM